MKIILSLRLFFNNTEIKHIVILYLRYKNIKNKILKINILKQNNAYNMIYIKLMADDGYRFINE